MAERTLAENVVQVGADFKAVKDALNAKGYVVITDEPTEEYGEYARQAIDTAYNDGLDVGSSGAYVKGYKDGYDVGWEDGHTDGYADGVYIGEQEVISNSKYIEKQATGKIIRLDDVSEVAHKVKVYGDNTEVEVCGKNLFDGKLEIGNILDTGADGNTSTYVRSVDYIPVIPNTQYTISREGTDKIYTRFYDADKNYIEYGVSANISPLSFTTKESYAFLRFFLVGTDINEKVQVEFDNATAYEPCTKQTITATPNGTEVSSMCPDMTFIADGDITVDYYGSYGMQAEYDRFWDANQDYGNRTVYQAGYQGNQGWNKDNFYPKYDIKPEGNSNNIFYAWNGGTKHRISLSQRLKECGVVLDTSKATSLTYACAYAHFTELPTFDTTSTTTSTHVFANGYGVLKTIEKIIVNENVTMTNWFLNDTGLENVQFEGTIGQDINMQWSTKLDLESLISLIDCLKQYLDGDQADAYTKTVTLSEESWALLAADSMLMQGNEYYWEDQIYNKGWNFG